VNALVVGLALPVNLMSGSAQVDAAGGPAQTGSTPDAQGATRQWFTEPLSAQAVPFVAAHAKVRLLRVEQGFGLAFATQVGVPVSKAAREAGGDPSVWVWPQLFGEKRFGPNGALKVGVNVGARLHSPSETTMNLRDGVFRDGNRITYGAGAAYRVFEPVDIVADTYATYLLSSGADSAIRPSNEVVGGFKIFLDRNSFLSLGAGPRFTRGFEAADFRGLLGFTFEPSIGDRDGDGVKDDVDRCPDEPEDIDGFRDADGCPDPDNDNDGIPDREDRCPNEPEDKDGDRDDDGCPEAADGDRDGDGIMDYADKCPDRPEDRDGFQDDDGCPELDNDADGILDTADACPNDAEDRDGFEDADGCPDPDNDKDQILDVVDACPNEPETYNGFQDEDGCPDQGNVIIEDKNIVILKKIRFKTGSADLLEESNDILDAVAAALIHHPEFTLVEISGHADERSSDEFNLRLTQDRVNRVLAALVTRKVEKSRLRSKGYGEFCPEDPAHNEQAWERNRRVEFKIVKTVDGPTGVELGCDNAVQKGVRPEPVP